LYHLVIVFFVFLSYHIHFLNCRWPLVTPSQFVSIFVSYLLSCDFVHIHTCLFIMYTFKLVFGHHLFSHFLQFLALSIFPNCSSFWCILIFFRCAYLPILSDEKRREPQKWKLLHATTKVISKSQQFGF